MTPEPHNLARTGSLALLNHISRFLMGCANAAELAERLAGSLRSIRPIEYIAVYLHDHQFKRLSSSTTQTRVSQAMACPEATVSQVMAQHSSEHGQHPQNGEYFLSVPILSSKRVWGACYVSSFEQPFDEDRRELLTALGQQAGLVLESLHLAAEQERACESLMHALALSIDARDELTAGHSARVAAYSAAVARYLGLSEREQRLTYYAGLLHDYGKIGIRDDVLYKPSRLTPDEYENIKQHPRYTLNILSKIRFSDDLADIPLVASSHHERPDGGGYPRGLKKHEIPMASRIIAVADFFDALTVERHYRSPMPDEEVLTLIEEGRETQFDGTVIDAFMRYYREEYAVRCQRQRGVKAAGGMMRHAGISPAEPISLPQQ